MALKRQTEGLSAEQAGRALGIGERQARALRSGQIGQFELQALQAMISMMGANSAKGQ